MACILFVDDDPFTLETYARMMSLTPHQALLASDAATALQMLKRETVDLVVLDHRLQGDDGFQALRAIRDLPQGKEVPVVMVSAGHESLGEVALRAGAQAYRCKPLFLQELLDLLEELTA
ncbi:MAG: response regulator [Anaerolineae bacterium]|nr:MAG: response regulator [Anaerolineae bacterium]